MAGVLTVALPAAVGLVVMGLVIVVFWLGVGKPRSYEEAVREQVSEAIRVEQPPPKNKKEKRRSGDRKKGKEGGGKAASTSERKSSPAPQAQAQAASAPATKGILKRGKADSDSVTKVSPLHAYLWRSTVGTV